MIFTDSEQNRADSVSGRVNVYDDNDRYNRDNERYAFGIQKAKLKIKYNFNLLGS